MKKFTALAFALAAGAAAAAGLYKWVDETGKIQYSDQPPPAGTKRVEQKKFTPSTIQTSELPYSLRQAVRNYPVTLWIFDCGEVCNKAREHLAKRGVPFTEKNPQNEKDAEAFKKISGGTLEVPLLALGNMAPVKGYQEGAWDAALDAAGYPRTPVGRKPATKPAPKPAAEAMSKPAAEAAPKPAPERAPQSQPAPAAAK